VAGVDQFELELEKLRSLVYVGWPERLLGLPRYLFPRLFAGVTNRLSPAKPSGLLAESEFGPRLETLVDHYVRNQSKMQSVLKPHDARLLVALQPLRSDAVSTPRGKGFSAFRSQARTRLQEAGVPVVDTNETSPPLTSDLFMDQVHLDARGNTVIAEALSSAIKARKLVSCAK
jgi:hypothetical protein